MARIDTEKIVNLNNIVDKEKAMQIHLEIIQGILIACFSGQNVDKNKTLTIPVSQETTQILK